MGFDVNGFLGSLADKAEMNNLEIKENDYKNEEGLLVCGTCGKPKQTYIEALDRVVPCLCDCDMELRNKEIEEQKKQEQVEYIQRLRSLSLIEKKYANARFENYEIRKTNEKCYRLCRHYAEDFDKMFEKCQCLLLWGGYGTGKTYAAACIANYLIDRGVPVIMTSLIRIIDTIQFGEEREGDIVNRLNHAKLVIFDDLGAERTTDYSLERVYSIIDSRYRKELPMIFTTNKTLKQMLDEKDERKARIYDRIYENVYPIHFKGESWRKEKAGELFAEVMNGELLKD